MSENKTTLQGHNERLSALVEQVESLPDAGGGDNIVLQSKTVSPSTDAQTVLPDDGYNGLSQVTVNAIKTQSKSVAPSTKSQTVMPDSDYDGLSQVVVDAIRTQPKSIMPLTTLQTVKPDSGYDGLSQVIVNAIPTATQATPSVEVSSSGLITASSTQSTGYVVGGTKKATKQLTTQGEKIVTPSTNEQTAVSAGVYTTGEIKVAAIPTVTQATPSISVSSSGLITASATQSAGYVSSGTKSNTKQLTTKGATEWTPSTNNQTISSGTYLTGTQTIKGDSNLIASNIKSGVSIFGVAGTLSSGEYDVLFATGRVPYNNEQWRISLALTSQAHFRGVYPDVLIVTAKDPSDYYEVIDDGGLLSLYVNFDSDGNVTNGAAICVLPDNEVFEPLVTEDITRFFTFETSASSTMFKITATSAEYRSFTLPYYDQVLLYKKQ